MDEFWRDPFMDQLIQSIINIFNDIEGVELVRLNGLTRHLNKMKPISVKEVKTIIEKLNMANVINYKYKLCCPHCQEVSYIIIPKENNNVKMCDTCQIFYQLELNKTFYNNNK